METPEWGWWVFAIAVMVIAVPIGIFCYLYYDRWWDGQSLDGIHRREHVLQILPKNKE